MSNISSSVKGYFKEVNTEHTKWKLRNGSHVDLSKDNIPEKDLRQLAVDNPELFVPKGAKSGAPDSTKGLGSKS